MKITVEHADVAENQVILRCPALDEEMLGVLSLLRSGLQRLCVWDDRRQTTLLSPGEVVYCETVDDRVFVYTGQAMYQTALSLGELENRYGPLGFFRAGKSAVVNLHHIRSLASREAGRIQATLETGEKLMVSRRYAPLLRERLGL
ncbi:LytTR family transcriptional regulator [Colidextribacter sp. OB.20]|uniref:LytTR family DNA-binding domain-containing protein n=1 Tax=Colidextribacter sp. OB.20 TaxID=2304568 RepID=UPI00136B74CA|nr:LytTR family DNA-binding domain-containing protein [Colidextribacter sp. OB.20]NBI09023.1 LytTR family transcriptional regulator [Colidextribacter sp. OB.20]